MLVAIEPETRSAELREFAKGFGKPIVFVDNAPFTQDQDYPPKTRFVGVSSAIGGRLAADALVDFTPAAAKLQRVLVLATNTQVARQSSFKQWLKIKVSSCTVILDEGCQFTREAARAAALRHFRAALDTNSPLDAVFCTADRMTLGCLDAINQTKWTSFPNPRVIGYDGIPATIELAGAGGCALERVVVQDAHNIAVGAVGQLLRLLNGEDLRGADWIDPYLHPSLPVS